MRASAVQNVEYKHYKDDLNTGILISFSRKKKNRFMKNISILNIIQQTLVEKKSI